MSLKQQLKTLLQKRDAEIKSLHVTYLHTRRTVQKKLSPDRYIRKYLGTSLGVAALAGFLLAPKPARPTRKEMEQAAEAGSRERGVAAPHESLFTHLRQLLSNVLSRLEHVTAPKAPPPPAASLEYTQGKQFQFRAQSLLASLLGIALARVDLSRILAELGKHFMSKGKSSSPNNGHHPDPSVADVGTVRTDDLGDFQ